MTLTFVSAVYGEDWRRTFKCTSMFGMLCLACGQWTESTRL